MVSDKLVHAVYMLHVSRTEKYAKKVIKAAWIVHYIYFSVNPWFYFFALECTFRKTGLNIVSLLLNLY